MRRKLIDLANQRTAALNAAETALNEGNNEAYQAEMTRASNILEEMTRIQNLLDEQSRQVLAQAPSAAEARDMAEERANTLRNGGSISFGVNELMRGFRNSVVVAGTIAQPTGAGLTVGDNLGNPSVIDLVRVQDMTGMGGWEEPYASALMAGDQGTPASEAGTDRTANDPTLAISQIKPYEVTTTTFVDRNIARLSPTAYMAKVQELAMRSLRAKISKLILCGDSEVSHVMFGMLNGTNKAGSSIVSTVNATVSSSKGKVDENLLTALYFGYGSGYEVGGNARLFLNKADLAALGAIRGTNEKRRLFGITPEQGNMNMGLIDDGGMLVPFCLDSGLTAIEGTSQGAAAIPCAAYGDPMNYMLGLFGDYTVRVDESYKAQQRLFTVLGDAVVGGNVIVDKGFVVAQIPATT